MMFPLPTDRARLATIAVLAASSLLAFNGRADAAIYSVGLQSDCSHPNVQAAVNAAQSNPGPDTIRIWSSVTWTGQQISINSDQDLELIGGFANCSAATPNGTRTELNGAGGDARPVLTIRGNGIFRLRNLKIAGGDQDGDDNGGGIYFEGGGILDIADSAITENVAYDGGGIYAVGTTLAAELVLGANVNVQANTARKSGGGVVAKSIELSLIGPGSSILFNVAQGNDGGGNGGGLVVVSDQFKSYAYISSNGIGGIGAIYGNEAVNGGGIAVLGGVESGQEAEVHIFSTDSANPVRINGNVASSRGGGIYLKPDISDSNGSAPAAARLWYAFVTDNEAADGGAAYLDHDSTGVGGAATIGSGLYFNYLGTLAPPSPPAALPCPVDAPCGAISGNVASTGTGAIVKLDRQGFFTGRRLLLQDNSAARLIDAAGDGSLDVYLYNSLITGNSVAQELLRQPDDDSGILVLIHATVADNTIGAPHVIFANDELVVRNSLVSQPGKLTVAPGADTLTVEHLLTNNTTNLPAGSAVFAGPRFVDPARGDYRPKAGARAVDYAPVSTIDFISESLDGRTHNIDVPIAGIAEPNRLADVGAFERQQLPPFVLNPDFDADLNLWDATGVSNWDGSQNASGAAGSGSLQSTVAEDDFIVTARSQCIHLPGPGTYYLNGYGRVTTGAPFDNTVRLEWDLRHNGGVLGCTDGAPDLEGVHVLAQGPTWRRPPADAVIEVSEGDWTPNTSLTINLVLVNGNPLKSISDGHVPSLGGPTGWFDGITLGIDGDDTIFADGFE
jgi:hypothetical protein